MQPSAVVVMVIAICLVWGGLVASIVALKLLPEPTIVEEESAAAACRGDSPSACSDTSDGEACGSGGSADDDEKC